MKKMVHKYRCSKYKKFTNGLLFAIIAMIALYLCITDIYNQTVSRVEILPPFAVAIISMTMGFLTMFHNNEIPESRI